MKFMCAWAGTGCDYAHEDEHEEAVLAAAEEHLKTHHPQEALERDRIRAIIQAGGPIR